MRLIVLACNNCSAPIAFSNILTHRWALYSMTSSHSGEQVFTFEGGNENGFSSRSASRGAPRIGVTVCGGMLQSNTMPPYFSSYLT